MTIYGNLDFVDKHYKPTKTDVRLAYTVTPIKGTTLVRAAEYIAGESSIGTWTKIMTMNPHIAKTLKPHIYKVDKKRSVVKIAYPELLFEPGNMPGILSSIAGNIYGMKELSKLRLDDIGFSDKLLKSFKGPQFGIAGIRKFTKVKNRPLLGTIVKPKVGLTSEQHADIAYEAWIGGLDIVKDDENLTSMSFNNFDKRMKLTFAARRRAEKETGEVKIYLANITAETDEMKRRAKLVKKLGGEFIMIDILTAGWASVQTIRNYAQKLGLAIHAHRAMHGALTRDKKHGMSMLSIAKISRLIGVDQLHIGTANIGKMEGAPDEVLAIEREIEKEVVYADEVHHALHQDWHGIKPVLAVASGGLSPLAIPKLVSLMGTNIVMQFGGGCHGHPDGTRAGATAIRQSWDATEQGISLSQYAKNHPELARALMKWGKKSVKKRTK
ncbi:type III ribulose-bisphosphate carboxylase [Candidatus Woesearchaeota archaeon]|nr:type III ribulose-bisphosphate carboxylase [Candidatus Woesearchaeota archaeon]